MKVLQINSVCGIGSTGRIATDIHNILVKQGHESYIAYGRDLPQNCDNTIKIGTKLDNYTHVLRTRIFDTHGFGSKQATLEFINKIKEVDPDIIHLHNIHGYYINVEILFNYLKAANKPVIWTLHDCWSFTGHCSHFDYIGCKKWKIGCLDCPQKKEYPKSCLIDNSEWNYEKKREVFTGVKNLTIVTPSEWLATKVENSFLNDYAIKIINNGIDLSVFKPTESNFREKYNLQNKFIILGIANVWSERKGFNYFLELAERIKPNQTIVLVGLTAKQKKILGSNIVGISRTNNLEELVQIYSESDVFINPALEDTFPTTNIEALASGTPVITFETGGSTEIIDKNTGIIIEQGDIEQLIDRINELDKKEREFNKDVLTGRTKQMYDKYDRYKEYLGLYRYKLEKLRKD
ncbi:glycosyltransferase [Fundicoccus sp. Sow4_F4]|uniref:glycosyltransferase n=1 Tax=Fundicoccus sp. Sow4_F4 TaxID=3438783 RepID=UPI003F9163B6